MVRVTSRELQQLVGMANRGTPKPEPHLDEEALSLALRTVDQLDESISHAEQTLRGLGDLLEDFTLSQALVGAMGISVTELRSQLPALREAVKDAGK